MWLKPKNQSLFPDIALKSGRISMRPPQISDWAQWAETREKNRAHIAPFEPTWSPNALEEDFFERRISRQSREWEGDRAYAFLIFKRADKSLIGGMNINNVCRGAAQFASIGYWIDKDHEGKGYMTEAIRMTLKYCFEDLDLHRVNASTLPENERSKKTLIAAGFKEEGYAEKYLSINGRWCDHVLYGMPLEEWRKLQKL